MTCGGRIATCRCIRREMSLRAENEFFHELSVKMKIRALADE